jgi:hypothetical protein
MNNLHVILLLITNATCINGMENYKEIADPLHKDAEKIITQPITIPSITISPKKSIRNLSMIHIEISPSSHLWQLGNHGNNSPEKRSPGTSLR